MAAIKTRIWQGGLAGITGNPAHASLPRELPRSSESQASPLEATLLDVSLQEGSLQVGSLQEAFLSEVHPERRAEVSKDARLDATRPYGAESAPAAQRGETQTLGWWEAKREEQQAAQERMACTRIMPIEELLAQGLGSVLPPASELEPRAAASAEARPPRESKLDELRRAFAAHEEPTAAPTVVPDSNRLRIVLLLALLAVGSFLVFEPAGSLAPATPAHARVPSAPAEALVAAPPVLAPAAAASDQPRTSKQAGQERSAIDALVAGDYARTHRLYSELARTLPAPSAFSEAARILSERARDSAPAAH